jgi:hypothetical protein
MKSKPAPALRPNAVSDAPLSDVVARRIQVIHTDAAYEVGLELLLGVPKFVEDVPGPEHKLRLYVEGRLVAEAAEAAVHLKCDRPVLGEDPDGGHRMPAQLGGLIKSPGWDRNPAPD